MSTPNDFQNHPPRRLFLERDRAAFKTALQAVAQEFGRDYPIHLGTGKVRTPDRVAARNPSHPDAEPLGYVHNAGLGEVERALQIATSAAPAWAALPVRGRCSRLEQAAALLAERQNIVAAWEVYEAAKSWSEALADVDEAIDYLRYYSSSAIAMSDQWRRFRPRGIVAVIPPWNFPTAIPCGMAAAALAAGNCVVLKPAEQTPLVAWQLVQILHEAGVPEEVLIWLPGRGEVAGVGLVESQDVDMVAFTGSAEVGTSIYRTGSGLRLHSGRPRTTLAEMGGKNPILVFADADLDEAVPGILVSAFGHSNQKCSAASRILIHQAIFPRLAARLAEGAASLQRGSAEVAGTVLTPLIDAEASARVSSAAVRAMQEGRTLLAPPPNPGEGSATSPTIVAIPAKEAAHARTTQEEIFGPVLALTPFRDVDEAIALANNTRYALTAGVYSRSPETIARTLREIDAGNVYVNRPTTGARVAVEPFGGHKMSGTGPKAGSSEYLWAFVTRVEPLRRGSETDTGRLRSLSVPHPFSAPPRLRAAAVRRALGSLSAAQHRAGPQGGVRQTERDPEALAGVFQSLKQLLGHAGELDHPDPTVELRGQQTYVRWDRPRGCGLVLFDDTTAPENVSSLIVAPLLAGNGVIVAASPGHHRLTGRLIGALHAGGVPSDSLILMPDAPDLKAAAAIPTVTFAAVDVHLERALQVLKALAAASAAPESPYLKALISLADGPAPNQAGFLRRFAYPKTVAIRTLHLGAQLDLPQSAGE